MRSSDDPLADGLYQLRDALFVAAYSDLAGVYTVIDSQVHKGSHVQKINADTGQVTIQHFASVNRLPIGYVVGAKRMEFHHLWNSPYSPRAPYKEAPVYTNFSPGENVISYTIPTTSVEYMYPALELGAKAIVLDIQGENVQVPKLGNFIEDAVSMKVPVFAVTSPGGTIKLNKTKEAVALREKGLVPLFDLLPSTAWVKALWALENPYPAKSPAEIVRRMLTNYVGEIDPNISEKVIKFFCALYD